MAQIKVTQVQEFVPTPAPTVTVKANTTFGEGVTETKSVQMSPTKYFSSSEMSASNEGSTDEDDSENELDVSLSSLGLDFV